MPIEVESREYRNGSKPPRDQQYNRELAEAIENYWRDRGYEFSGLVFCTGEERGKSVYSIRSNSLNGVPLKRKAAAR